MGGKANSSEFLTHIKNHGKKFAVAVWLETGQGFQNTQWPAVRYFQWWNLTYLRIPANPNYHRSIKKSQAIPKCFIDLKFSVWFTPGSENETMFCDT